MQLLIATTNQGKLSEYREIFAGLPFELRDLRDAGVAEAIPETGDSFEANALIKASGYARITGMLTLADDSGLEVASLGGAPGIQSARFGGPGLTDRQRNELLLERLREVPFSDRAARFVCSIAIAAPDGPTESVEASLMGVIDFAPHGANGFGYDPIFFVVDEGKTMAELSPERKNRISHRARAAEGARAILARWLTPSAQVIHTGHNE
ncbi:MAG TPA: RdgB/HAM1 family non-canonical purine NTP pyrophosphatase [Herpetosiphonaceae bacterium]|nr:RdgB/HAM1 family non-canonical purine NTP pyrophosphatase [Herpetosiphonaceae bacterium]